MKNILKLLKLAAMALLITAGAWGNPLKAQAAEEEAAITITKQLFENTVPEQKQNTGLQLEPWGTLLDDAEFTIYDVTERYHTLLATIDPDTQKNYTPQHAREVISMAGALESDTELDAGRTGAAGNATGTYTFSNLPKKSGGKDAAYLIVETDTPPRASDSSPLIIETAQNMVVVFPVYEVMVDENGQATGTYGDDELDHVYLYPKNISYNACEKLLDEDKVDFTIGQAINYSVTVDVPFNFATAGYRGFGINDRATDGLSFIEITGFDVLIPGATPEENTWNAINLVEENDYTLQLNGTNGLTDPASGDNHFDLRFALDGRISIYSGQTIRVRYTMALNELAIPDSPEQNKANIFLEDNEGNVFLEEDLVTPEVFTGGRKFIKLDGHTGAILPGAAFVLQRQVTTTGTTVTEFAQFQTADNTKITHYDTDNLTAAKIVWGSEANATSFASTSDGKFEVRGLEYTLDTEAKTIQYAMKETSAPNGYALLKAPVAFTVARYTYNDDRTEVSPGDRLDGQVEIKNTPKGMLPSTGGIGILAFLLIGASLVTGATVWYKKSNFEE